MGRAPILPGKAEVETHKDGSDTQSAPQHSSAATQGGAADEGDRALAPGGPLARLCPA